jgi:hypothetical protein
MTLKALLIPALLLASGPLKSHPSWTSSGDNVAGATFGAAIASADVNGDGYPDLIVGAPNFSGPGIECGKVYVYFGSRHGFSKTPNWTATGSGQFFAQFGFSVAAAGDVNGDGYDDIVVGEPYFGDANGVVGKAYLYLGSPSGPSATPDWTSTGDDQDGAEFGFSVSTAGDVTGDGFADVVIGAPLFMDASRVHVGKAYVFGGSASGPTSMPVWQQTGETITGLPLFGQSVSTAGDVNGDGYSEIIVGAPFANSFDHYQTGKVYVFRGGPLGLTLMPIWDTTGDDQENSIFGHAVAPAGDVNGDGFDDILIGAPSYTDFGAEFPLYEAGKAYVYLGSESGLEATPVWTSLGDDQINARFGSSVAGAGDADRDGFDDVIIGAPLFNTTPPEEVPNQVGKAYVYLGTASGPGTSPAWTSVGENQTQAFFGSSVSAAGDSDVAVGARLFDTQNLDAGKVCVYEGGRGPRPHRRRHCR